MSDAPDETLRDRPDRKQMMEILRLREELERMEQAAREAWALGPNRPSGNYNATSWAIRSSDKPRRRPPRRRGDSGSAGALVPA